MSKDLRGIKAILGHRVNLEYKGLKAIPVLPVQKALKVQKAILDLIGYLQNKS